MTKSDEATSDMKPQWKSEIRQRLAGLQLAPAREAAIVEELAQHLDDYYEELLACGATPVEAERRTRSELSESEIFERELRRVERQSNPEPIVLGTDRRANMIATLWQDLRFGARMLLKQPGFTLIAVLTLALGIGANTAIFSIVNAVLLRPFPYKEPERLVILRENIYGGVNSSVSYLNFADWRSQSALCDSVAATRANESFNFTGAGEPERLQGRLVSAEFFSTLGISPLVGRDFLQEEDRPGAPPAVILSYEFWRRRFGADPSVIGKQITLNNQGFTVVGVTPPNFKFGMEADVTAPIGLQAERFTARGADPGVRPVARLKPGVSGRQAETELNLIAARLEQQYPESNKGRSVIVRPLHETLVGDVRQPLLILLCSVGLVLLIACANVANLLLARASGRHREMAVRLALGAGRWRVIRRLLTESALLAASGGALGMLFAWWGTNALAAFARSGPVMSALLSTTTDLDLRPDERVFAFTSILCLGAAILFGLAPALRSSKVSLTSALTGRSVGSDNAGGRFGPGRALVIAQVALSLLLLVGAGLFARTLSNLKAHDLGFDQEHTLLVWMAPVQTGRHGQALAELCQTVEERLSSLPGALSASVSMGGVLDGGEGGLPSEQITIQGQAPRPGLLLSGVSVAPGFLKTVGIPLLQGRGFTERDNETSPRVAVINETMARFFFGGQNPIGRRFGWLPGGESEIVGVVKDAKTGAPRDNRGVVYSPYRQYQRSLRLNWSVAVRAAGVRQELRNIDPRLPILRINTIKQQLDDVLFQERLVATLSALFGLLAFLLASLGLYGVVSYTVASRTNDIGIRLALGATPSGAFRMIFKESLALALAGVAIGVPVTLAATRLISSRLFGVGPADPFTIASAASLLLAVAAIAALIPARRAARVDPMVALRSE
jgi:putative ABC transport system permease protein